MESMVFLFFFVIAMGIIFIFAMICGVVIAAIRYTMYSKKDFAKTTFSITGIIFFLLSICLCALSNTSFTFY